MNIIFIRHGDPDYAHDSLTEKGMREAKLLNKRILEAKDKINAYYVSSLGRAKVTAKVAMQGIGAPVTELDWMQEFCVMVTDEQTGKQRIPWDYMPAYWTEKPNLYDRREWMTTGIMTSGNIEHEYLRVTGEFDKLLEKYGYYRHGGYYDARPGSDETIVIFCHLGSQFVMLSHLFGISPVCLWQSAFVAPTSLTVVVSEEREPGKASFRCKMLGDISHLVMGGEPASDSGLFPRNPIQI